MCRCIPLGGDDNLSHFWIQATHRAQGGFLDLWAWSRKVTQEGFFFPNDR